MGELAQKLTEHESRVERRRHLREARDAAVAHELALIWKQEERRLCLESKHMALAFQLQEGGVQANCRFCSAICLTPSSERAAFCSSQECSTKGKQVCSKVLSCGHPCNGICEESQCNVPCCTCGKFKDETCGICLDKLPESPVILLDCGHCIHYGCAVNMIKSVDWRGRKICFAALRCLSGCGKLLSHDCLSELMAPIMAKHAQIEHNVKQRAALDKAAPGDAKGKRTKGKRARQKGGEDQVEDLDLKTLLAKYVYYECYKCREPYCGGLAECRAEDAAEPDPESVQCPSCMLDGKGGACPTHGAEFMAIKCDFCCSEALFRCGGSVMYCDTCHQMPNGQLKDCDPTKCPLRGEHPKGKTSQWMMGCAACRC